MLEADKMSEEEIINRLKERIKIDRSMRLNVESDFDRFCEEECQAIEGLIDLYNKEKLNSSNLSEQLNKEKERNMNLELENIVLKEDRRIAVEETEQKEKKAYIDGTNIAHNLCNKNWEDKIKAKIEEVKDGTFDAKIVLQSLLEKE